MSNVIVSENSLPGSPTASWELSAAPSPEIEGFVAGFSIAAGEDVQFKINSTAPDYRIDIYRLGYYDGDGARFITSLDHHGATEQPDPLVNEATGLVDAGNWDVTDVWNTPSDLTTGVYIAKLVREDGTYGENHIPFVVRDEDAHYDLTVQLDDTTWQAYNQWGGHSLYDGQTVAVSYNRPTSTFGLFSYAFPAIRWLEQNGYNVNYVSGRDVAQDSTILSNSKAFISLGHDEYWSSEQRNNVEDARDSGTHLLFWGGNDIFWKTRWEDSFETLVTYKTSTTGRLDPTGEWTGLWRDPQAQDPGIKPENALSGTMYMVFRSTESGNDPIEVGSTFSANRFWRNTDVASLNDGESLVLGNYLGYEWNMDALNDSRPSTMIHLSSTTVGVPPFPPPGSEGYKELLYSPPGPVGSATHNLTLYRADSGALVFSAGTISWVWALDEVHSGVQMPENLTIQQAMVNLLADMGVQPGSISPDLVQATASTDKMRPTIFIDGLEIHESDSGNSLSLSGSSADLGGGTVASVLISTDGGLTWLPVAGTTSWEVTAPLIGGSTDNIRISAVDDSLLRSLGARVDLSLFEWANDARIGTTDLGWNNIEHNRVITDVNGDGVADYVGFGAAELYVNLGAVTTTGQLQFSFDGYILDQFAGRGIASGAGYAGNLNLDYNPELNIIWQQTDAGVSYVQAAVTGSGTLAYDGPAERFDFFSQGNGFGAQHAVEIVSVDITEDIGASIIGFRNDGMWLVRDPFGGAGDIAEFVPGSNVFGHDSGWLAEDVDIRAVRDSEGNRIDLNKDGILDVIGIGASGVVFALGQIEQVEGRPVYSLGGLEYGFENGGGFSRDEGWRNDSNTRNLCDLNGDGNLDIIGFGDQGAWVALGNGTVRPFDQVYFLESAFGANTPGWAHGNVSLQLGDVNGDDVLDVIAFGEQATTITTGMIHSETGMYIFGEQIAAIDYTAATGWRNDTHLRDVVDFNQDGVSEVVVSGDRGSYILTFGDTFIG